MPGLVIGSPLSQIGEAWIGASDAGGGAGTVQPPLLAAGAAFHAPKLNRTVAVPALSSSNTLHASRIALRPRPSALLNAQGYFSATLRLTLTPALLSNAQTFFDARALRIAKPAAFGNAPAIFGPRLTLHIAAAAYANSAIPHAASITQPLKAAPHRPSQAQIFGPSVTQPAVTSITVTLSLPGVSHRAPRQGPRAASPTWPNLPKVDAPPWRLTVVTPQVARDRLRAHADARKRAEQQRRKRKAGDRADEIFRTLIDEEIVRTVVKVMAER